MGPAGAPDDSAAATPRRRFLAWGWTALGALVTAEFGWIVASFLRPRREAGAESDARLVVAGPVEQFEPGTVTAFPAGRFYLARLSGGGFLALDRTCTHLGCTVPWNAETKRFECPCHASSFTIEGSVISPPAPRPLDLYAVRIENGIVKVDTSRKTRRASFEPAQVVTS